MSDPILSPAFLFRFSTACRYAPELGKDGLGKSLEADHKLPSFGDLEGKRVFADLRMAWHEVGLAFDLTVSGKSQPAWCRETRVEDSDGLRVWIDTRDAHNIHRASRFCHRFTFLPFGAGARGEQPIGFLLPINRARELPKPVEPHVLRVQSARRPDGYSLRAFIPATAITGFDPAEQPKLGFSYAIVDRELGWQTFSVGPEFPFDEDPSLWGTVELVS